VKKNGKGGSVKSQRLLSTAGAALARNTVAGREHRKPLGREHTKDSEEGQTMRVSEVAANGKLKKTINAVGTKGEPYLE